MQKKVLSEIALYPLFSSPLMAFQLNLDNKKILHYLQKLKYKKSNSVANESYISLNNKILKDKSFINEKKTFEKAIKKYLEKLHYTKKFKILNSWGTKTGINGESLSHVHLNTWISAVYYPEFNPSFGIIFEKGMEGFMYNVEFDDNDSIYSSKEFKVMPQANTLLIFPSHLCHKIAKNNSDKLRYSLSFNINPVGTFKKGSDCEITYK
jgi:uncharacterized protein (TIGR02466 family)